MPDEESYLDVSLRKIAKGAGVGFTGTFVGMMLGYLSRMVIARLLGSSDYGLVCLGFAGMSIAATLSLMGLPAGVKRFVSFYKGMDDERRIKGTLLSAVGMVLPASIVFMSVFFFGADWLSIHFFHEPRLSVVLRIFALGVPFWVLSSVFIAGTVGFQDLRYRVYVNDIFQNVAKLVFIVILVVMGYGVIGASLGWVLAIVLMPFLAFYFLEKRVFPVLNTKVKAIPVHRELFFFSIPLIFAGIVGLIMGWTDTLMLGYFCTASEVGIYNAALPTARLLGMGAGAFGVIFMPVVSELYAKGEMNAIKNVYTSVTKWILMIVSPIFLLMFLFSDFVMEIMFGSEYIAGGVALSILAFSYFISSLLGLASRLLQAYGRTEIVMICSFFGAGANFALNLLLIPIYGVKGAAFATGCSIAAMGILHLLFIYKVGKLQPFRMSHLKPVSAALIAVLVVYVLTRRWIRISLYSSIPVFFVFMIIYSFLLLVMKSFEEEDLVVMRAIDQRLGTKSDWLRKIIEKFL